MTAQQSATEAQCPTAQQSVSSTAQQITTYTKLPNRVCPKAFVQHKSNFKSKSNTIRPTLKSPPYVQTAFTTYRRFTVSWVSVKVPWVTF